MTRSAVGILGIGRLGEALANAALSNPDQDILCVTRRGAERVARLCETDPRVRACDPEDILQACDYLVISLGASSARELLGTLTFQPRHQIISVMAEMSLAELRKLTAGAGSVSRVLALPAVSHGGQMIPVYPVTRATEHLFGKRNTLITVASEQQLLAYWSITGLLSSVLMIGDVAARWLEDAGIETRQAEAYARTLFSEVHDLTENGLGRALQNVSTPNGLNVMMRKRLLQAGLEHQLKDGLDQINQRLLKGAGASPGGSAPEVIKIGPE